jgi:hypothetical protein
MNLIKCAITNIINPIAIVIIIDMPIHYVLYFKFKFNNLLRFYSYR